MQCNPSIWFAVRAHVEGSGIVLAGFSVEGGPMDRYDERRGVNDTDETSSTNRERDVLGLGDSTVPQTPGDPGTSYDPESVRRRRERAMGSDEESRSRHEDPGE
jgi:hypothetical protein